MTTDITETFEGGSNGATLTTSNTAFSGIGGTAANCTFDSAIKHYGALSYKLTLAASTGFGTRTYTLRAVTFIRFKIYIDALPSADSNILSFLSTATLRSAVRLTTAGKLALRNNATTVYTSTTTLATATWYRCEYRVDSTNSQQQLRIYLDPEGVTANEDSGNQTYTQGTHDRWELGCPASATVTLHFDDVTSNDTAFPGRPLLVAGRAAADSATPSDSAARSLSYARPASDSATPSDAGTRSFTYARPGADSASPSDSCGLSGLSMHRTAADTASPSDSATRSLSRARAAADTATPADAGARSFTYSRAAADSATPSDSAVGARLPSSRSASDTATPSDSATRALLSYARGAADTATPGDAATRGGATRARSAADSASPSDAAARASSKARAGADSASPSDTAGRRMTISGFALETATPADLAARAEAFARFALDVATPNDTVFEVIPRTLELAIAAAAERFALAGGPERWATAPAPDRWRVGASP